jgi:hypothetical protein
MSDTKEAPGYLFQFTCDCGNGRQLTVSGNFDKGAEVPSMNAEVDKLSIVFDRLRAQHEAPLIVERLEGSRGQLESMVNDLEQYHKKHPKPDASLVLKMEAQIAAARVNIAKGEILLAQTQLKAK